jgi:hypothetical protein
LRSDRTDYQITYKLTKKSIDNDLKVQLFPWSLLGSYSSCVPYPYPKPGPEALLPRKPSATKVLLYLTGDNENAQSESIPKEKGDII